MTKIIQVLKEKIKHEIKRLCLFVMKPFERLLEKLKTPKSKSVMKIFIMGSYCTLICAAILISFKSVFNLFDSNPNSAADENTRQKSLLTEKYLADLLNNHGKSLEVLSKPGARGEEIAEVQTALKNLGYYLGGIDGIFGVKTQDAVMRFQKARGLTADGIIGVQTLKALGLQIDAISANHENEINLLAKLISAEAGGESYACQVAVGAVVLNRVKHDSFPDSISAVIYQPDAFASIKDGKFDKAVTESAYRAARDALNGMDPADGAVYFYNPKTNKNKSLKSKTVITTIGRYNFCS